MYVIRVWDEEEVLGVSMSGHVGLEEALRAVSQSFALAEAGGLDRCVCDLRELTPGVGTLVILGTGLSAHLGSRQRVALVCNTKQISACRRLARVGGFDDRLGIFSREADAIAWLELERQYRLGETALRHFQTRAPQALVDRNTERATATG